MQIKRFFSNNGNYPAANLLWLLMVLSICPAMAIELPFSSEVIVAAHRPSAVSVFVEDVDGDNDLDILTAAFTAPDDGKGLVTWFANDGSGGGWTEHVIDNFFDGAASVHAADLVTGNTTLELIAAAYDDDRITWWEKDVAYWNATDLPEPPGDSFSQPIWVHAAQLDDDSRIDIIGVANNSAGGSTPADPDIRWWKNNGNGNFAAPITVTSDFNLARMAVAVDMNGDTHLDILGAAHIAEGKGKVAWWQNNGFGGGWTEHVIVAENAGFTKVDAAMPGDFDGDLDTDVVAVSRDTNQVAWWENTDSGGYGINWVKHTIATDFTQATSLDVVDMDGDGDMDILSGSRILNQVVWWENNNGNGTSWTKHVIGDGFPEPRCIRAADLDGDANVPDGIPDLDVVAASFMGDKFSLWTNDITHLRIKEVSQTYNSLQGAYNAASANQTIQSRDGVTIENTSFHRPILITIEAGYNTKFSLIPTGNKATVRGSLSFERGTVVLRRGCIAIEN